jgi:hypothetical protein
MNRTEKFQISGGLMLLLCHFDGARFRRHQPITALSTAPKRTPTPGSIAIETADGGNQIENQYEPKGESL